MKKAFSSSMCVFITLFMLSCFGCAIQHDSVPDDMSMENEYSLASDKSFIGGCRAFDVIGNINVVVEIPAGTVDKWEMSKNTGQLMREFRDGSPRVISYIPYPGNYGMIPGTLLPSDMGGDGDPLDVILLGPAVPRGSVLKTRPIGVLHLLDRGEQDDKIIAVMLDAEMGHITSLEQLNKEFKGVAEIIQIWFSNYKGPEMMQAKGFGDADQANSVIKTAIDAYQAKNH